MLCPCLHSHTQAPPGVPQETHGYRTPLMRDRAKEPPPEAMKAMTGLSREQQLDFQGAWPLLCALPPGYLVNSIQLRAAKQISLEYWETRTPGSQQPRWNPLNLMLAATVPSLRTFLKDISWPSPTTASPPLKLLSSAVSRPER